MHWKNCEPEYKKYSSRIIVVTCTHLTWCTSLPKPYMYIVQLLYSSFITTVPQQHKGVPPSPPSSFPPPPPPPPPPTPPPPHPPQSSQEPGTREEIKEYAARYGAEFDLFSKIDVNGAHAHPLYKYLKMQLKGSLGK